MTAHKEAFLRCDECLSYKLQRSSHIQWIVLIYVHPWMLIKRSLFAHYFAYCHEMPSFLLALYSRTRASYPCELYGETTSVDQSTTVVMPLAGIMGGVGAI